MVFSSTVFLFLFFPLVLILYNLPGLKKHRKYRNVVLLFASIFFYAWGEPLFVFLMLLSIVITWLLGKVIGGSIGRRKKALLVFSVIYHLGILIIFKYLTFLSAELNRLLGRHLLDISIALPIGISFFTFQMMSYLFDVYYGHATVQSNILNLGLYVSFFPQLIAGPIVRYETIEKEIMERKETREDFQAGLKRFVFGLGKKVLIADFLAVIADNIFSLAHVGGVALVTAWIGAVAYMLQIYFDFSGYSDMAIGLGLCFGFHFKENFSQPYLAESVNDFWKRWHISLTDWFRDYVYIPLGGNRVTRNRHFFNTFLVWILTGIWHGANWTFLFWGIIYCLIQLLEKYAYTPSRWPRFLRHFYTLLIVCLCWVIFRAQSLSDAASYFADLLGRTCILDADSVFYAKNSIIVFLLAIICCLPLGKWLRPKTASLSMAVIREATEYLLLIFILSATIAFSVSGGYSPFIYFNF